MFVSVTEKESMYLRVIVCFCVRLSVFMCVDNMYLWKGVYVHHSVHVCVWKETKDVNTLSHTLSHTHGNQSLSSLFLPPAREQF